METSVPFTRTFGESYAPAFEKSEYGILTSMKQTVNRWLPTTTHKVVVGLILLVGIVIAYLWMTGSLGEVAGGTILDLSSTKGIQKTLASGYTNKYQNTASKYTQRSNLIGRPKLGDAELVYYGVDPYSGKGWNPYSKQMSSLV